MMELLFKRGFKAKVLYLSDAAKNNGLKKQDFFTNSPNYFSLASLIFSQLNEYFICKLISGTKS